VKVVKNKVAPPFKQAEFDIIYGEGISREGDILDLAAEAGIIEKSGAWYTWGEERIGQGRDNARIFLKENPKIYQNILKSVYEKFEIKIAPPAAAPANATTATSKAEAKTEQKTQTAKNKLI